MRTLTLALISVLAFTGCVPPPPLQVEQKYALVVNQPNRDEQFIDDLGISLKPVMMEQALKTESLFANYQYWNPKNPAETGVTKELLVSLPVFEVQVSNTSQHAVSFQKVAIRLVDDAGNSYQALLKQDVLDSVDRQIDSLARRGWTVDRSAAVVKAKSLKLIDKNYESLPSLTEKRILAFDFGDVTNRKSYYQLLKNSKYVRIMLYNVPVKFDPAGNVTKVAKFEYLYDVVRR